MARGAQCFFSGKGHPFPECTQHTHNQTFWQNMHFCTSQYQSSCQVPITPDAPGLFICQNYHLHQKASWQAPGVVHTTQPGHFGNISSRSRHCIFLVGWAGGVTGWVTLCLSRSEGYLCRGRAVTTVYCARVSASVYHTGVMKTAIVSWHFRLC